MVKVPLMIAKPVLKKFRKEIEKRNKASKDFNKKNKKNSFKDVNKAQQRLDSAKEYTQGVIQTIKNKLPPSAVKMVKKGFDEVVKRRKEFRDAVAESTTKKLTGRKPNFKGGLIRKPKLAKKGY
jgi:hypothetical protein